jgi:excisionase family DNA binding protein
MKTKARKPTKKPPDSPDAESEAKTPLAVTVPQAAALLNVGCTTVKKAIAEGRLRSVLIFGARRIPMSALREFAEKGT